jgi:outer membrane protein assembly factor BamB
MQNQIKMRKEIIIRAFYLLSGIFCLLNSCKKLPPAEEFDPSNTRLSMVWSKPFYTDSSEITMLASVVADRYIAFIGYAGLMCYKQPVADNQIVVFDKTNGNEHPVYGKGIKTKDNSEVDGFLIGDNKDIAFYYTHQSLYAFQISTGKYLWITDYNYFNQRDYGRPSVLGSDILVPYYNYLIASVDRYNSITGEKTSLSLSFDKSIGTIQWAMNERNDTLLFFFNTNKNAYCYNLTKDSVVWINNTINPEHYESYFTTLLPIVVENKYVIFQTDRSVNCLDFSTGELIWKISGNALNSGIWRNSIRYHDGKIIIHPWFGDMSCYDIQNGNLLWKNTDLSGRNYLLGAYKNNLYFICGGYNVSHLHCISLTTGQEKWKEPGPNKGIYGILAIDQQTGYLYCHSRHSIICVDLNKTPKK